MLLHILHIDIWIGLFCGAVRRKCRKYARVSFTVSAFPSACVWQRNSHRRGCHEILYSEIWLIFMNDVIGILSSRQIRRIKMHFCAGIETSLLDIYWPRIFGTYFVDKHETRLVSKSLSSVSHAVSVIVKIPKAQCLIYVPQGLTFQKSYVPPTEYICVFCMDLRTRSYYFPNTPSPCFRPFCFNVPCHFTQLLNVRCLVFGLTPFGCVLLR
jgi:hypothetical protein